MTTSETYIASLDFVVSRVSAFQLFILLMLQYSAVATQRRTQAFNAQHLWHAHCTIMNEEKLKLREFHVAGFSAFRKISP